MAALEGVAMLEGGEGGAAMGGLGGGGGAAGMMQKIEEGTQIANKVGDSAIELAQKGQKVTHAVRSLVAPIGKAIARGIRAIERHKKRRRHH